MAVELINDKKKILLSDIFNEEKYYVDNIFDFDKKIKEELNISYSKIKEIIKNQKELWSFDLRKFWIKKIKDLINFEWLNKSIWFMNNTDFIEKLEIEEIEKSKIMENEKIIEMFNKKIKKNFNLSWILWCDKEENFNLENCDGIWELEIKQFFIVEKNMKVSNIYDTYELSENYFNEIYGIIKDSNYIYNFNTNKLITISYLFDKKQFLIEIIDYEWDSKNNNIIYKQSELFKYIALWTDEKSIDFWFKQYLISAVDINNFNFNEILELKDNEIIIDDNTIINENADDKNWLSYNYSIEKFNNCLNINDNVKKIIDGSMINEIIFDMDDINYIEMYYWESLINSKKDIKKIIDNLNINREKENISINSYAEVEWLYYTSSFMNISEKNISYKNLYKTIILQIITHYIIYYITLKVNNIDKLINNKKENIHDIIKNINDLDVFLNIKQDSYKQKIKINI